MIFCPKCGCLMRPKKEKDEIYLLCSCGHRQLSKKGQTIIKERVKIPIKKIKARASKNYLATHHHVCKHCGYDKAELIILEPWYGDEDGIVRYKCGKCGKVQQGHGKVR